MKLIGSPSMSCASGIPERIVSPSRHSREGGNPGAPGAMDPRDKPGNERNRHDVVGRGQAPAAWGAEHGVVARVVVVVGDHCVEDNN